MFSITSELDYKTTRSSGKGGQNVNKVETAVEARWHLPSSTLFSEEQKEKIFSELKNKINKEGFLISKSMEARSQLENKIIVTDKINRWVNDALIEKAERKPTKIPRGIHEKRLNLKKQKSDIKKYRNKKWDE